MPSPPQAPCPFGPSGRSAGRIVRRAGGPLDERLEDRLSALLRDVGAHVRRGEAPSPAPSRRPTGLPAVDTLLEGGFPEGRLSEIAGPTGSGRTSLVLALLARITAGGSLAAVVDPADAFDPPSASAAGVVLDRVLWVRPRDLHGALRSTEQVLVAGGFAGVLLDLTGPAASGGAPDVPAAAWPRLRRRAAAGSAALVVVAQRRLAGTFADLAVALERGRPIFLPGPAWLAGMDSRLCLVRNRSGPDGGTLGVGWRLAGDGALAGCLPAEGPEMPVRVAAGGEAPQRIRAA